MILSNKVRILFKTVSCLVAGIFLFCMPVYSQETDVIAKKTTSSIVDLLASKDPAQFAKAHDIELKAGMIKVVMTVDDKLLPKDLPLKYELKEFRIKGNTASAYVRFDMLKKICEEPAVTFIRTSFKFKVLSK